MTISNVVEAVEILHNTQRRKRWAPIEKHKIIQETYQPGPPSRILLANMVYPRVNYSIGVR